MGHWGRNRNMTAVVFSTNPQVVVKETAGMRARGSCLGGLLGLQKEFHVVCLISKETKALWEKKEGLFVVS